MSYLWLWYNLFLDTLWWMQEYVSSYHAQIFVMALSKFCTTYSPSSSGRNHPMHVTEILSFLFPVPGHNSSKIRYIMFHAQPAWIHFLSKDLLMRSFYWNTELTLFITCTSSPVFKFTKSKRSHALWCDFFFINTSCSWCQIVFISRSTDLFPLGSLMFV